MIIETLYSKLQHLQIATNRTSDVKSTYENIEKILRQLESQGEDINNRKIATCAANIIKVSNTRPHQT